MTFRAADYARAAPLNALTAGGIAPWSTTGKRVPLDRFRRTPDAIARAISTAGLPARTLLSVLVSLGGRLDPNQFRFETAPADPSVVDIALSRLLAIDLVTVDTVGGLALNSTAAEMIGETSRSLVDTRALTSDEVAAALRTNGLMSPSRKGERLQVLINAFTDVDTRDHIRANLSKPALELLDVIADIAGLGVIDPDEVGVDGYAAKRSRLYFAARPSAQSGNPIDELLSKGIIGLSPWDDELYIWREAWPLLERPIVQRWPTPVPVPQTITRQPTSSDALRIPTAVTIGERILVEATAHPIPALKNGEPRFGKTDVRQLAKRLHVSETQIDIVSTLLIGIGLLRLNVVHISGRGRKAVAERAWMIDPTLQAAWVQRSPGQRWARLLAEWLSSDTGDMHRQANRHLLLWELMQLADDAAIVDVAKFATWAEFQYGPVAHSETFSAVFEEMQAMGLLVDGLAALTALSRSLLTNPASSDAIDAPTDDSFMVQADLTVIASPHLAIHLVTKLERIATLESDGGARVYRLDAGLITAAIHRGSTVDELIDFLAATSSASLPDPVTRLIHDAANSAGSAIIVSAATTVIVDDAAHLAAIVGLKSLKLRLVAPHVAVTEVAAKKVAEAFERKGVVAKLVTNTVNITPRSIADDAAIARSQAARIRAMGNASNKHVVQQHADMYERTAQQLADIDGRLTAKRPLALTTDQVNAL